MQFLEDVSNRFNYKIFLGGGMVLKIWENWKMLDLQVVNEGNK